MSTALAKVEDKQLEAQRQIMTQRTPEKEIRTRPGRGGKPLKYTDGAYVIRTLNEAFGWDWDFLADNEELVLFNGEPFEVKVRGTLTVRLGGQAVTKTQFGCQPIEMLSNGTKPVSIGDAYKGAATDAMKKCASLLGIALDLYDSDYKAEKYGDEPQPQPLRKPDTRDVPRLVPHGQQPTDEMWGELPDLREGAAGHVVKLAKTLKWGGADLAQCVYANFGTIVMPGKLADYLSFATKDELRELYRIMNSQGKGGK